MTEGKGSEFDGGELATRTRRTIVDDRPAREDRHEAPASGQLVREEILGARRATLSDLVNGNAALSPEMTLRIEKAFGVPMDTLLRMQAWHDSHAMRQRAGGP